MPTMDIGQVVRTAGLVVAAADAPETMRKQADYVCDGHADDEEINAALAELLLQQGGELYLTQGLYKCSGPIGVGGVAGITGLNGISMRGAGVWTNITHDGDWTDADLRIVRLGNGSWSTVEMMTVDSPGIDYSGCIMGYVIRYWKGGYWTEAYGETNCDGVASAWLTFSDGDAKALVVTVPRNTVVDGVQLWVYEAFNSDGTNLITVGAESTFGPLADADFFIVAEDVSTTGLKVLMAGVGYGIPWYPATTGVVLEVYAYYDKGAGSTPTTGAALITVNYHRAPNEPY